MEELKRIKKYYGEEMMHLCRQLFPQLLEYENLLFSLLEKNFGYSKFLASDIIEKDIIDDFKNYINGQVNFKIEYVDTKKTPEDLLKEKGYILYECNNEEEIQAFKKYYAKDEALCTFNGGRLNDCYVFFAIKTNVDEIKREDFTIPSRQDEYGTSVISIQFSRGTSSTLSIKNRYNHKVFNPDATFSNNLENIIPGLTKSFENKYGFKIKQEKQKLFEERLRYVKASDGKYYKFNYVSGNVYYCPNNIIIDNLEIKEEYLEKEKYLIIDYFIIDLVNKKITLYNNNINDSFISGLQDIEKIDIIKSKEYKVINIILKDEQKVYIKVDKFNRIISYRNDFIKNIDANFLIKSKYLKELLLPQVVTIGDNFLSYSEQLSKLSLPTVTNIGKKFLHASKNLNYLHLPQVITIDEDFLAINNSIKTLNLPSAKTIGDCFLEVNTCLEELDLPQVLTIGDYCLNSNRDLKKLNLPQVVTIGDGFLTCNKDLEELDLPQVVTIGADFMSCNQKIRKLNLPKIPEIGENFLESSDYLKTSTNKTR